MRHIVTFDVKLYAAIAIAVDSPDHKAAKAEARKKLRTALDLLEVSQETIAGANDTLKAEHADGAEIVTIGVHIDDEGFGTVCEVATPEGTPLDLDGAKV